MHKLSKIACLSVSVLFVGCSNIDSVSQLQDDLDAIESKPVGSIEPKKEFPKEPPYAYSSAAVRSPFNAPEIIIPLDEPTGPVTPVGPIVEPEPHPKEPLEDFSFDSLTMVGTIQRELIDPTAETDLEESSKSEQNTDEEGTDVALYAIILDDSGNIHRVTEGNYVGRDYGKIIKIEEDSIQVREIIPDTRGQWIERPRTMILREQ